jgi:cystathionine beta-lyase
MLPQWTGSGGEGMCKSGIVRTLTPSLSPQESPADRLTPSPGPNLVADSKHRYESMRFAVAADADSYNDLPTYPVRPSYKEFHSQLKIQTQCVVFEGAPRDPHKPSAVPIYATATFVQPSATEFGAYDYTRSGNPTRTALEKQVAMLEGAHAAFAFGSGMAALAAVTRLLKAGDELIVGDDIYGGMHRLVSRVTGALHGVKVKFVDTTDLDTVRAALTPSTRMLHMESPTNPMMRITDVRRLASILHDAGVLLSIDSTMMSPILQRPLYLGADIVVHSATKFFGGHSDVMGGLVCLRDEELSKRIAFFQNAEGSGMEPFSCWLFLRGIKTLALRVERAQANAQLVAEYLSHQAAAKQLFYPGIKPKDLSSRAGRDYAIHFSQASGAGCVMSFTTGSVAVSRRLIDALRIFKLTVSFGSVNSLCEMPCVMSHASIPADKRRLPDDLIRLSIGIEEPEDLIADIAQAFELAIHPLVTNVRSVQRKDSAEEAAAAGLSPVNGAGATAEASDHASVALQENARLNLVLKHMRSELTRLTEALAVARGGTRDSFGASSRGAPSDFPAGESGSTALWKAAAGGALAVVVSGALALGAFGLGRRAALH